MTYVRSPERDYLEGLLDWYDGLIESLTEYRERLVLVRESLEQLTTKETDTNAR